MSDLTDRQILVLIWIRDGKTIPYMVEQTNTSNKTIQDIIDAFVEDGLVEKVKNEAGNTVIGGRRLTKAGRRSLKDNGHDPDRSTTSTESNKK